MTVYLITFLSGFCNVKTCMGVLCTFLVHNYGH